MKSKRGFYEKKLPFAHLPSCPLPLFSPVWPQAALLLPGDRVSWRPIDAAEYRALSDQTATLRAAALPPLAFLLDGEPGR